MKRILVRVVLAGLALFLVIQLVPYGRDHANPPVTQAAVFRSAAVNRIVTDSCADCHSNLTKWPWYTNVAPVSWLVKSDVDGGRENLNLSEWNTPQPALENVVEAIQSGSMPPLKYKIMPNHSKARLSSKQKKQLVAGFTQLYATQPPASIRQGGGG
jgi:hypothetical protein